jgi:hypothetical protein
MRRVHVLRVILSYVRWRHGLRSIRRILSVVAWSRRVMTLFTFTKLSARHSSLKAFTIFLSTVWFLTITSLLMLFRIRSNFILNDFRLKSIRVSFFKLQHSLVVFFFIFWDVSAIYTIAIFAKLISLKTFAVKF